MNTGADRGGSVEFLLDPSNRLDRVTAHNFNQSTTHPWQL
jgi:hypothetical protein